MTSSTINLQSGIVIAFLIFLHGKFGDCTGVVHLTDDDFDSKTAEGVWFVNIFAPWCPACKSLAPVWDQLAVKLEGKVNVAKVDGPDNIITARRFGIHSYPSLYLMRDGRTYEYNIQRDGLSLKQMAHFATEGWRDTTPRSWLHSPNSLFGRTTGRLYRLPRQTSNLYFSIQHRTGLPHPVLLGGFLTIVAIYGGLILCVLDMFYTRHTAAAMRPHQH